jgi:N-acetylglucosamine-6-phosphate deacetylase
MSLVGTYINGDSGAVLEITDANDSNGQGKGTFMMGDVSVAVAIHYHFDGGGLAGASLLFSGFEDRPNNYVGCAGYTNTTTGINGIRLAGGLAIQKNIIAFSGLFVKK